MGKQHFVAHKRPLPDHARRHQHQQPPAKKAKTAEEVQECVDKTTKVLAGIESNIPSCEELVDKLKDTGVMFTCEVVDHMPYDEVLSMKTTADATGKEAKELLGSVRTALQTCRADVEACRGQDTFAETKKKFDAFHKKVSDLGRDINTILTDVNNGSQKAQAKKRMEEQRVKMEEKKAKQEEALAAQRLAVQKVVAFQMIIKMLKEKLKEMKSLKEVVETESIILSMQLEIEKDVPTCSAQGQSQNHLRNCAGAVKNFLKQLQERRKEIHLVDSSRVDQLSTKLAQAIQSKVKEDSTTTQDIFKKIADGHSEISDSQLEDYAEKLELGECYSKELIGNLYGRALVAANIGLEETKEQLSFDDFNMHIARALYSSRSAVLEIEEGETKKKHNIEDGEIVEIIEGPSGDPLKCRCRLTDGKEGSLMFKSLQRMSPQFTVVQETVLTDRHELKGFSVVQRLKPGRKIIATQYPEIDNTTKLLRVAVEILPEEVAAPATEEGAEKVEKKETGPRVRGFVTVKGNRGSQLLKQDAPAPAEFGAGPVTPKEMTIEAWTEMIKPRSEEVCKTLEAALEEITSCAPECEQKCAVLEALKDGWTEEVLTPAGEAARGVWEKVDKLIQDLAATLVTYTKEFQNVHAKVEGPLTKVKATIEEVHKSLLAAKQAHEEGTKQAREVNRTLMRELEKQNREKQLKLDEEFMNKCIDECIARKELALGMDNRVKVDVDTEAELLEYEKTLEEAKELCDQLREKVDEMKKATQGKTPKKNELHKAMGELMSNVSKLNHERQKRLTQLQKQWDTVVDKSTIVVVKALRDQMEMNQQTEEALFTQISGNKDVVTLSQFQEQMKTLKVDASASIIEKIFARVAPKGVDEIARNQFVFLTTCFYTVIKATIITKSMVIQSGETLCRLKVDDSVSVIAPMEIDSTTAVTRCLVSFNDGEKTHEGYVTVKGNQGTTFLQPQSFFYKVNKDTVITEQFEMANVSIIRRLKVGDIVRARSIPKKEEKSGLTRLEVMCMLPKKAATATTAAKNSGFVTLKGNQGTEFLTPCSITGLDLEDPPVNLPEPEVAKEDVEMVKETKETAEVVKDTDGDVAMAKEA